MPRTTRRPAAMLDALQLLIHDHKEVKALFKAYDQLVRTDGEDQEKQQLALDICARLTVHVTLEEELLYPVAREVLADDQNLVDEADVEHASVKALIAQIVQAMPGDPLYDAKVKVLGEYIDHHVRDEEDQMFPKLKRSALDLEALGEDMAMRKEELLAGVAGAE